MNKAWATLGVVGAMAGALGAQEPASPSPSGEGNRLLTLGTPMLRVTMERLNVGWGMPEGVPDFRLKVDRVGMEGVLTPAEMETRLRGVEIRLPMEGFWVGYEKVSENEEPRATISIQRGF